MRSPAARRPSPDSGRLPARHQRHRPGPVAIRYSWPAVLNLMAGLAGLRLTGRYADWDRRPFTSASDRHISVYQPA
jgi:hypothetical protein